MTFFVQPGVIHLKFRNSSTYLCIFLTLQFICTQSAEPMYVRIAIFIFFVLRFLPVAGQHNFTLSDTLRGSITPERAWWNVMHYDIAVEPDFETKSIQGHNILSFVATASGDVMQIDLQEPMVIDSVLYGSELLNLSRLKNVYLIQLNSIVSPGDSGKLHIHFSGIPREARTPPWDGGWIWTRDNRGNPWMSVACQGLGASVWVPCKDHQSDKPDRGASLTIIVPDTLSAVGNGNLVSKTPLDRARAAWKWAVTSPINSYNIIPYIGKYAHWQEKYLGANGELDLNFWVLEDNLETAKKHFAQVHTMLDCFEEWLGPYPFYADGYKLVEAPHLGMEHQSAIAYGNKYRNGYMGRDLSQSGWGMGWDFIIIHESGHEWFGNSITSSDIADMWIHEGFTAYSETIYIQCQHGVEAGNAYVTGTRKLVQNDAPVIGPYGVNQEGSGDMYYKASNMIHTIRHVVDNDSLFKEMMRGLNKTFYHQTVTTGQVEAWLTKIAQKDLSKIFDQYLRTTQIPVLEYRREEKGYAYRWANSVPDFNMPLRLSDGQWLLPTTTWQKVNIDLGTNDVQIDKNFYSTTREVM